jgi:hypothetical protein
MKDGLTTDELLALGFTIDMGGTEASDGDRWLYHCGGCSHWHSHVNQGTHPDYTLCDRCKVGLESFGRWAAIHIDRREPT